MKKGDFNSKGFTIIEVSLVLAIAGLIFLMIFIALPALQRSQRDTARREDITELMTAIKKYQQNNRGALPNGTTGSYTRGGSGGENTWTGMLNKYVGGDFNDPSGPNYTLVVNICGGQADAKCSNGAWSNVLNKTFDQNIGKIYVLLQAKCAGNETQGALGSNNTRKIAVLYKLESGGVFCLEN